MIIRIRFLNDNKNEVPDLKLKVQLHDSVRQSSTREQMKEAANQVFLEPIQRYSLSGIRLGNALLRRSKQAKKLFQHDTDRVTVQLVTGRTVIERDKRN